MDMKQIRYNNLLALRAEAGNDWGLLAERVGTKRNYFYQMKPDATGRGIGNDLARRCEVAFQKPHGWMDQTHKQPGMEKRVQRIVDLGQMPLLDYNILRSCLVDAEAACEDLGLSAEQKATVVLSLYIQRTTAGDDHIESDTATAIAMVINRTATQA